MDTQEIVNELREIGAEALHTAIEKILTRVLPKAIDAACEAIPGKIDDAILLPLKDKIIEEAKKLLTKV